MCKYICICVYIIFYIVKLSDNINGFHFYLGYTCFVLSDLCSNLGLFLPRPRALPGISICCHSLYTLYPSTVLATFLDPILCSLLNLLEHIVQQIHENGCRAVAFLEFAYLKMTLLYHQN